MSEGMNGDLFVDVGSFECLSQSPLDSSCRKWTADGFTIEQVDFGVVCQDVFLQPNADFIRKG